MPTHLHLITSSEVKPTLPDIMRDFKSHTSKKSRSQLEVDNRSGFLKVFKQAARMLPKQIFKIWQDEYHPLALISEKWLRQKMDYMHHNPVRKGFVEFPEHWKYSSARNWILNDNRVITLDKHVLSTEG